MLVGPVGPFFKMILNKVLQYMRGLAHFLEKLKQEAIASENWVKLCQRGTGSIITAGHLEATSFYSKIRGATTPKSIPWTW